MATRAPRPSRPVFRPRFTLMILYVFALFFVFCFLMVLPPLLEAARSLPPGPAELTPEERELASRIARDALAGRVHFALALALLVVGVGAWTGKLPGLRPPA